jgi:hypothetical protein
VLIANDRDKTEFPHASEGMRSYIGTARVVTEILGEQLFAPVRSHQARLYRYQRNGKSLTEYLYYLVDGGRRRK